VFIPPFFSNVEVWWDQPDYTRALVHLGSYAKVLIFDKRGTGLSDRAGELPGMEQRMDDLRAVIDAVGMEQAALLGVSEGDVVRRDLPQPVPSADAYRCLRTFFVIHSNRRRTRRILQIH
jgi:pimeloyl-ACP methyl ester carboxylesterase